MRPAFRRQLLQWYARHARELPWRSRPTPYRVWVSEVMLQQTRVEAVRGHFARFIKRFPSLRALAAAELEAVLQAWSGLGYYRRARMLHAAARQIVQRHNGRFPRERHALLELPGIGPYSAGAILSIAFDQPEPIVDGNVERVFSRLAAIAHDVKSSAGREAIWQLAREHVEKGHAEGHRPSALNQALMELGAMVCLPAAPDCAACPVRDHCAARKAGREREFPVLPARASTKTRRYRFIAARDEAGRVLLVRRQEGDSSSLLPAGLWELPQQEAAEALGAVSRGRLVTRTHSIMNYRLQLSARNATPQGNIEETTSRKWHTAQQAKQAAMSSATRKLLQALGVL
ncbi:MAG: A/G-specific adenine glycosylase [Planctomycetes bacterium]|nr:A/G-specific adenine glycosylase [Planctomycetota bacterium]MCB9936072.1 A/G-specific adenine glycosylase [Planctomycetota bacterium]